MSTPRIEHVITRSLNIRWNCTWSISGIQEFIVVLCHEMGWCKSVAKVGGMDEDVILIFADMSVLMWLRLTDGVSIYWLSKNKSLFCCELKTSVGEGLLFFKDSSDS